MQKDNTIKSLLLILLAVVCILFTLLLCSGCEVFKFRKENKTDSTAVKKKIAVATDSSNGGSVKKEETKSKEENEWWRLIQHYGRDTVTNNFYPQPATIIYEGGRGNKEESTSTVDSSYYQNMMRMVAMSFDSLNRKVDSIENKKHSETKGVGLITLLLVAGGAVVLLKLMGWVGSNYSFVKVKK